MKAITAALTLTAALLLSSCEDQNNSNASSPPPTPPATTSSEPPPTATPPADSNTTTPPPSTDPSATSSASEAPAGFTVTPPLSQTPVRTFKEAEYVLKDNTDYQAVIETDAGRMVVDLYEDDTPTTVNSFVWLALHKYYDGIAFHRVIDDFVVQGGDPNTLNADSSSWGQGGPGYEFGLEIREKYKYDTKGVLGMARTQDPNSNGSQFYITLGPTPNLDGQYTIFGKVVEGLDVLDSITRGEPPATPTRMTRVSIVEKSK
jgi:cyclophilin family peptidyl-prolyl cis-trans isomerase